MKLMDKWDQRFYNLAKNVSEWSKDPSKKVGAVIVDGRRIIATGYNGLPHGIEDNERLFDREWKLKVVIHAEVNAILNAAKNGASTRGCTIYVNIPPCSNCGASIIQAGIRRVVCQSFEEYNGNWKESFQLSKDLLTEAGVDYENPEEMSHVRISSYPS